MKTVELGLTVCVAATAEKMQAGTNASGFDLLTGNFDRTKTAFRELSQQVATLDTVDAFMAGYYDAAKRQQLSN